MRKSCNSLLLSKLFHQTRRRQAVKYVTTLSSSSSSPSSSSSSYLDDNKCVITSRRLRYTRREFANILQAHPSVESLNNTKMTHARLIILGLASDTFLSNVILDSYSKQGCIDFVQLLFDRIPEKNSVSWSTMVSMYNQHGFSEKALWVFLKFRKECNGSPNEFILPSVIRACVQIGGDDDLGGGMHCLVIKSGFEEYVYVGTSLIHYYVKRGNMDTARYLFDGLDEKSTVTWTTMISGYEKSGRSDVSLRLFEKMKEGNTVTPDRYVLSSVLSACSKLGFIEGGKQIHGYVLRRGIESDVSVANVLIDLYTKCGRVKSGQNLFDGMVVKNAISWTSMISGYMQNSLNIKAVNMFVEMVRSGWKADAFACTSVLTSCGSMDDLGQGKQVHAYTIKTNLERDEFVTNSLIDMYAKCDSLIEARRAFDAMAIQNVIAYNAMIEGYSRLERLREALDLFREMRLRLLPPSLLTYISILGVSSALSTLELSKQVHALTIKAGVSLDIFAASSLIDVYSKCSCIKDARLIFEEIDEKDIVVWNAMLFGYTQQMENEEALKLFHELQMSRQKPNDYTLAALVTAASNLASLPHGRQFHSQLIKIGLDSNPFVANSLIDMYAKCGSIEDARKMFDSAAWEDVACWNSMISKYAHHGEAEEALCMFEAMMKAGIKPNYVTFVGLLSACGHVGWLDVGFLHFKSMHTYNIEPRMEHYASMVSLLGRAGRLNEAKDFINKMPIKPAAIVWRSLLSACRMAGNVELGIYAAEMAIANDPTDSGSYILLSNILASQKMWTDVKKVRNAMELQGVVKEPGCSWIELDNDVHVFISRDRAHQEANLIYSILAILIQQSKEVGYEPDTTTLLLND